MGISPTAQGSSCGPSSAATARGFDEILISAAVIESLAENLSDGFVAPLLAYALGGLPAAIFYRAANTADSMIGYRDEYEYLGKAAARLGRRAKPGAGPSDGAPDPGRLGYERPRCLAHPTC